MGRKLLGGCNSSLLADRDCAQYNETLEHTFEVCMANLDQQHKKKRKEGRKEGPLNVLVSTGCFRRRLEDDAIDNTTTAAKSKETAEMIDAERDAAVFLFKDGSVEHNAHYYRPRRRPIRNMLRQVKQRSIQK
eukprot:CAMPEP_0119006080 /NCGR_PEP_ID=MMETSP1176-20130426/2103_1 /TAXON_ID=265551 /ORGANISM="Synedropsis recta cf, Strain CCMP1620" /LENGTH=132 /DNA_ID=CAMNT_0006957967 /DNA_START=10 /DNA_END=408 /DNA_ORIENTATION=-